MLNFQKNEVSPRAGGVSEMADAGVLSLSGMYKGGPFQVTIEAPVVMEAIELFESPETAIDKLLTAGACATRAVTADHGVQALRNEVERLPEALRLEVERLQGQVGAAFGAGGPLDQVLAKAKLEVADAITEILTKQADGDTNGTLMAKMQAAGKQIDEILQVAQRRSQAELQQLVNSQNERLGKLVQGLQNLDPATGLGQAMARIQADVKDLTTKLAAREGAATERERGTAKGRDYEAVVVEKTAQVAAAYGDLAEATGTLPGETIAKKGSAKRGDVTVLVGGEPAIVLEAMNRDSGQLRPKAVMTELAEAMANRGARTAIAVMPTLDNQTLNGQPLQMLADNRWAVYLDSEAPDPLALQVAYRLARAVVTAPAPREAADLEALARGVEEVNSKIGMLAGVRTQLLNMDRCTQVARTTLEQFEREVSAIVGRLLGTLEGPKADAA